MRTPCLLAALLLVLSCGGCSRQYKVRHALARGKAYAEAAELEKAKITYLGVIRLDPRNAEAYKRIGLIWSEQGSPLQTARFLTRAGELNPRDEQTHAKLALALAALQDVAPARKAAETVLRQDPQQADALWTLAQTAWSPEEASELAARLQKLDGDYPGVLLAGGLLALQRQDFAAAETAARKAIAKDPKSDAAHALLGAVFLARKEAPAAEDEFLAAAQLVPRSNASLAYAQLLLRRDPSVAKKFLDGIAAKLPDYLPLWVLQARIAVDNRQPAQALAALEHVFSIDGTNYEARLLQGQVLLGQGEIDRAIAVLDPLNANVFYTRSPALKVELARAYVARKNPTQATALLNEALKLRPDFSEAALLLAQVEGQNGDVRQAVARIESLLQKQPTAPGARLLLAQAQRSLGNLDGAASVLQEQLRITPEAAAPRMLLGSLRLQQGRSAEARALFEEATRLSPKDLQANAALVECELAEKDFDAALRQADSVTKGQPDAPEAWLTLAGVYLARQQGSQAEAALKKCLALDANSARADDLLVELYVRTDRLAPAAETLAAFAAKNPTDTPALTRLGILQEKQGNWEEARRTYEKLLAVDPDAATALNNLAVLAADRFHQLDKAAGYAARAHTLRPDDAAIADTLGWICYQRKDDPQALALLRDSAGKLPQNPEAQFHYGMVSYRTGQTQAARAALTKAAAFPGDFPGKNGIAHTLDLLNGSGAGSAQAASDEALLATLRDQPQDAATRQRLSERFEQAGAFGKAAGLWEEALKLDPGNLTATLKLAGLNAGPLHDPAKAFDYAKRAHALAPNDPVASQLAGQTAYRSGNFAWAYSLLQEGARRPDAGPALLHDFAWTAYDLGRVAEARRAMQRALDAAPAAPSAPADRRFLEWTKLEEQPADLPAREAEIQAALKEEAQDPPALMLQAALDTQRQQVAPAVAIYRGILDRLPDFGPAQKRLAALELEQPGGLDAGYDLAVKAHRNLPDDPEAAQILAAARFKRKEFAAVVPLLRESAAKRPLNAKLLYCLGMSQLAQKQKSEGSQSLNQALAAGLAGMEAQEAKRILSGQPTR